MFPDGYGENHYDSEYYAYDTRRPRWKQALKTALWRTPGAGRWFTILPPKHPGKVLEIGCGHGIYLDALKSIGWDTYGTEISPKAVAFCQRRHKVFPAKEAQFPDASFDWVTMDNVFEHIAQPHELLNKIRAWLKPDGVLTVCVPNYSGIDSRFWGAHWYALMPPHHEFHYTEKGLRHLLSDCGFTSKIHSHVRFETGHSATLKGSREGIVSLQARKLLHLATAPRLSSEYGYFITGTAIHAT